MVYAHAVLIHALCWAHGLQAIGAEAFRPVAAAYTSVFGAEKAATDRLAEWNAASSTSNPPFPGVLDLSLTPPVASASLFWSVSSSFYDEKTHSIIGISARWESGEPNWEVTGLTPGDYTVAIEDKQSGYIYRRSLHIGKERTSLPIHLDSEVAVEGVVAGVPTWAQQSPYFLYGTMASPVGVNGEFKCKGHIQEFDLPMVLVQVANPFPAEYEAKTFTYQYNPREKPVPGKPYRIELTQLGSERSLVGHIEFLKDLTEHGFSALASAINLEATSTDGSLTLRLRPDFRGRFIFAGLPHGTYRLTMPRNGDMLPLTCHPQEFAITDQALPPCTIEVVPLP